MNYSGNKKVYYFEIYHSEECAGTSYKYSYILQSLSENLSHSDLELYLESTFQKLVYGLENEDHDISYMFCSQRPDSEVHLSY